MSKSVLITGASSGIGFATAVWLQKSGFQVYGCARKQADLDHLEKAAPGLRGVILDVTKSEMIEAAVEDLRGELEQANEFSLINNAGIAVSGPIEAIKIEDLKTQFDVNVFGLVEVTQAFLPWIRKTRGRIVNISSVSGLSAPPFLGAYSASKFAVESLSDALRRELLGFGVKVILVEPGPIATPIWQKGLGNEEAIKANMRQDRLPLYIDAFEKFKGHVQKTAEDAIPAEKVAKVIHAALTEKNPPLRQVVASRSQWLGTRALQLAPARLVDFAIQKALIAPK